MYVCIYVHINLYIYIYDVAAVLGQEMQFEDNVTALDVTNGVCIDVRRRPWRLWESSLGRGWQDSITLLMLGLAG